MKKTTLLLASLLLGLHCAMAQQRDTSKMVPLTPPNTVSKFDEFNAKARAFFKVFPVPIISYSQEAGNIFGLAKFNAFHPVKKDTISKPSKISGVGTVSTKGRVSLSVASDLILKENKYMILSYFNYRKTPQFMLGIGNDVSRENVEEVSTDRIKLSAVGLVRVKKAFYAGVALDFANYFTIKTDSNSFLIRDNVAGLKGGSDVGIGIAGALDNRDNRYNTYKGELILASIMTYPKFLGSAYQFSKFEIDARKFHNPWRRHVIALQTMATYINGNVPFYDLALLGGENIMRGYYQGAIRDKVLLAAQAEYRMPIWNIFGLVTWIGTGRVADQVKNLSLDGLWLSYGAGLRIQVDADNNINLRVDAGFGPKGVSGVYLNFAEAF